MALLAFTFLPYFLSTHPFVLSHSPYLPCFPSSLPSFPLLSQQPSPIPRVFLVFPHPCFASSLHFFTLYCPLNYPHSPAYNFCSSLDSLYLKPSASHFLPLASSTHYILQTAILFRSLPPAHSVSQSSCSFLPSLFPLCASVLLLIPFLPSFPSVPQSACSFPPLPPSPVPQSACYFSCFPSLLCTSIRLLVFVPPSPSTLSQSSHAAHRCS